jgi:hypothetical protein
MDGGEARRILRPWSLRSVSALRLRDTCQAWQRRSRRCGAWRVAWPAARRADRVAVSENGIDARTLAGHESIAWSDVAAIRRARTTWGR